KPHVLTALTYLANVDKYSDKQKYLIIGGGAVGCELAYFLSYEKNKEVTVVEMLPYFMKGTCTANRGHIIHYLERKGVKLINCATVKEIKDNSVLITRKVENVPDPYAVWQPVLPESIKNPFEKKIKEKEIEMEIPTDYVIISVGLNPNNKLYFDAIKERVAEKIYNIGDSYCPGRVFEAVKSGYLIGRSL
ncbi:MAG: FAD-dependent oxidoreductase, partial [Caldisericia bacterium]|nr:FAD-dependent oxidoreductase [Caldisericia bacterium]